PEARRPCAEIGHCESPTDELARPQSAASPVKSRSRALGHGGRPCERPSAPARPVQWRHPGPTCPGAGSPSGPVDPHRAEIREGRFWCSVAKNCPKLVVPSSCTLLPTIALFLPGFFQACCHAE